MDLVSRRLRQQMLHVERLNRRVALADIPGKVIPGSQEMDARTLRLDLGRSADGRVVKSPKIRWQEPGAGTLKVHSKPADNEQMRLRSPSGTVGTASLADWSTYDADNAPPSTDGDEAVIEYAGKTTIRLTEDAIVLSIGGSSVTITQAGIQIAGTDIAVHGVTAIAGDRLTHNGLNVGFDHVHSGVQRGAALTNGPQ